MNAGSADTCRREIWIAARLMPFLAARRSLEGLLRMSTPARASPRYKGIPAEQIINLVRQAARRPWLMRDRRCLREGLLAFRFLSLAGYCPELRFSVASTSLSAARPRAHCRVTLNGKTVLNPCPEPMIDLFSYDGRAIAGDAGRPGTSDIAHA
jgi:transglutaminase superfamily protein